jgi:cell division septum initiation protein DivIVA
MGDGRPEQRREVNVDVRAKLAEIRRVVEEARSMPMSASVVVNRQEVLDLLVQLEQGIDEAFGDADRVLRRRDELVDEGRKRAELIVAEAHNEQDRLVSDTEVFRLAQRRAEELLVEARSDAEGLRAETDDYVDSNLATFEITLARTIEAVRRGRERLAGRSALDSLTETEADKIRLPEHLEG